MNKLMKQLFIAVIIGSMLSVATSCSDEKEVVTPEVQFPESKTLQLASGETTDLSFSINADFRLSVSPAEASRWFYIKDGTHKVSTLNKKAGTHTITIGAEEDEDFEARSCEIVMHIGEKSQTVAQLTRSTIERTLSVYVSKFDEYGTIKTGSDVGEYEYEATPLQEEDLVSFRLFPKISGKGVYRDIAIKVVSNNNWVITNLPEWIESPANPSGNANEPTCIKLKIGKYNKLPLEDTETNIEFSTKDENNESVLLKEFILVSPGVRNLYDVAAFPFMVNFEIDGTYIDPITKQPKTLQGNFYCIDNGVVFYKMNYNHEKKQYETAGTDWITVNTEWSTDASTMIRQHTVSLSVTSNAGNVKERLARVIAVPKSVSETITDPINYFFTADKSEVKDEFDSYVVARISQKSIAPAELRFKDPAGATSDGSTLTTLSKNDEMYIKFKGIYEKTSFAQYYRITEHTIFYHLDYSKPNPENSVILGKEAYMANPVMGSGLDVIQLSRPDEYTIKMDPVKVNGNPDIQYINFFDSEDENGGLKFLMICTTKVQ